MLLSLEQTHPDDFAGDINVPPPTTTMTSQVDVAELMALHQPRRDVAPLTDDVFKKPLDRLDLQVDSHVMVTSDAPTQATAHSPVLAGHVDIVRNDDFRPDALPSSDVSGELAADVDSSLYESFQSADQAFVITPDVTSIANDVKASPPRDDKIDVSLSPQRGNSKSKSRDDVTEWCTERSVVT